MVKKAWIKDIKLLTKIGEDSRSYKHYTVDEYTSNIKCYNIMKIRLKVNKRTLKRLLKIPAIIKGRLDEVPLTLGYLYTWNRLRGDRGTDDGTGKSCNVRLVVCVSLYACVGVCTWTNRKSTHTHTQTHTHTHVSMYTLFLYSLYSFFLSSLFILFA